MLKVYLIDWFAKSLYGNYQLNFYFRTSVKSISEVIGVSVYSETVW